MTANGPTLQDAIGTIDPPGLPIPTPWELIIQRSKQHLGLIIGGAVVAIIVLIAIFAPYVTIYDPLRSDVPARLHGPVWGADGTWDHFLGTDYLGRDLWSRIAYGARSSLIIGFGAATISAVIGTTIGIMGGYFGGRTDAFVLYLINCRLALPAILVVLSLVSLVGRTLTTMVFVLALLFWDRYAVVIRTATQQISTADFITAARAVGASHLRIMITQILPNVANHIIVVMSLETVILILVEATLSYLGLGVPPPRPSWGSLIADGREYMLTKPYVVVIPGMALFTLVVAINMLGDGIRDVTAPEGRN